MKFKEGDPLLSTFFSNLVGSPEMASVADIDFNYSYPFPPPDSVFGKRFAERVEAGKENVLTVVVNIPDVNIHFDPGHLEETYVLLGQRALNTGIMVSMEAGRWSPLRGKLKLEHLGRVAQWSKIQAREGRSTTFAELMFEASFWDRIEQVDLTPVPLSKMFNALPFQDLRTGENYHVVVQLIRQVSSPIDDIEYVTEDLKRPFMRRAAPANGKNQAFDWFRLGELPGGMTYNSRLAVYHGIKTLSQRGYHDPIIEKPDLGPSPASPHFLLGVDTSRIESTSFAEDSLPYLYSAFYEWRQEISNQVPEKVKRWLNPSRNKDILELDKLSRDFFVKKYNIHDYKDILERFNIDVPVGQIPQTIREAQIAVAAWIRLMNVENWVRIHKDFPRLIKINAGAEFIPKRMKLGETSFIKTFDRFILPDIKGASWVEALYGYIAADYRNICDLTLKKSILDFMFEKVGQGRIFDVGCGIGLAQEWKPAGITLFGIDLAEEMLGEAKKAGEEVKNLNIADASLSDLPHPFDGIIMSFVDNWFTPEERARTFKLAFKAVKPGGHFIFNVHLPENEWEASYANLLMEAGFSHVTFYEQEVVSREGKKKAIFVDVQK